MTECQLTPSLPEADNSNQQSDNKKPLKWETVLQWYCRIHSITCLFNTQLFSHKWCTFWLPLWYLCLLPQSASGSNNINCYESLIKTQLLYITWQNSMMTLDLLWLSFCASNLTSCSDPKALKHNPINMEYVLLSPGWNQCCLSMEHKHQYPIKSLWLKLYWRLSQCLTRGKFLKKNSLSHSV